MNMFLNDGNMVQVHNMNQFEEVLEDKVGSDSVYILNSLVTENESRISDLKEELDIQMDSTRTLINGMVDARKELSNIIIDTENAKRLNRKQLIEKLKELEKMLDTTLMDF